MIFNDFEVTFEYIESLLKNHRQIRCEIEILELELSAVTDEKGDAIESIVFKGKDFNTPTIKGTGRGDSTFVAMMGYQDEMENIAHDTAALQRLIWKNGLELKKLDTAVEQLEETQKNVIKGLYYENLKWKQIRKKYFMSDETINNNRVKGIEQIVAVFKKKNLRLLEGGG